MNVVLLWKYKFHTETWGREGKYMRSAQFNMTRIHRINESSDTD